MQKICTNILHLLTCIYYTNMHKRKYITYYHRQSILLKMVVNSKQVYLLRFAEMISDSRSLLTCTPKLTTLYSIKVLPFVQRYSLFERDLISFQIKFVLNRFHSELQHLYTSHSCNCKDMQIQLQCSGHKGQT